MRLLLRVVFALPLALLAVAGAFLALIWLLALELRRANSRRKPKHAADHHPAAPQLAAVGCLTAKESTRRTPGAGCREDLAAEETQVD
jgi:hypothetical protein